MKKLLLFALLVCAALTINVRASAASATTLIVKNTSSCTLYYRIIAGHGCTTPSCATTMFSIAPGGMTTYSITGPYFSCSPNTFQRVQVFNELSSTPTCPLVSTQVGGDCGFPFTGGFGISSTCSACAGQKITVNWIDAGSIIYVDIS